MAKNNFFKNKKFLITIVTSVIIIVIVAALLVSLYNYLFWEPQVVPENKKTLKFKIQPGLFDEPNGDEYMIFEEDDIKHYRETFVPLPERIIFPENINDGPTAVNGAVVEPQTIHVPRVDLQNVHDSTINKYIRSLFEKFTITETPGIIQEIQGSLGNLEPHKRESINKVLADVATRNGTITNLNGASELGVLSCVWQESQKDENIKDMLFQQIIDTHENGHTHCPTGFITRISTALLINKPEDFPKTKELVKTEMFNTAANLRTELEKDDNYKELSDDDQSTELKTRLLNKYNEDYKGIFTDKEITELTKDWIDHV